MIKCDN